jgi:23S rRNA pseudouridine2605 synthase
VDFFTFYRLFGYLCRKTDLIMPGPSRKPDYSGKKRPAERRGGDARKKKSSYGESGDKKSFRPDSDSRREPRGDKPAYKKPYFKKDNREEGGERPYGDRPERKSFRPESDTRREPRGDKPPYKKPYFKKDSREEGGERKKFGNREEGERKPFVRREEGERKPFVKREDGERKTFGDSTGRRTPGSEDRKKREFKGDKPYRKPFPKREDRDTGEQGSFGDSSEKKSFRPEGDTRREPRGDKPAFKKPYFKKEGRDEKRGDRKPFRSRDEGKPRDEERKSAVREPKPFRAKKSFASPSPASADGLIRLNKYIANAGICSRREADKLIESGVISVNGKVVTELGFKISAEDVINFGGQTLKKEKMVYILLNKPKDYITTLDDPEGRKTVLELIRNAGRERVYPVGRLDRNTTGLLLLTNDGDLTKKLTHPRYGVRKIYHVTLDKALTRTDLQKAADGIELEDGIIKADEISYVGDGKEKTEIGIQLHSGRNRIVRRMFEHMGYEVVKLDRVYFAGLTKKDLPRGRWRILTPMEISMLKMVPSQD